MRETIFNHFYSLPTLKDQRNFIVQHVKQKDVKRRTTAQIDSRRKRTFEYCFTVNNIQECVCMSFFMATLDITESMIRGSFAHMNSDGFMGPDMRGKQRSANKIDDERQKIVENHIKRFPTMESHYCRASSNKMYLSSGLNVSRMHSLYEEDCERNEIIPVNYQFYNSIFKKYNLSFHVPKKDICKKCTKFDNMDINDREKVKTEHEHHLQRKKNAREERDSDKNKASNNDDFLSFNFDLQAVLNIPKAESGIIFYKRKLAVYNFTVYNLGNSTGNCYIWDETQGRRGSNEIATCLFMYLTSHQEARHVSMMSDACGGQNRNATVATMCIYAVKQNESLQILDHKFFETGHSQMECDSIHSKIEQRSKYSNVYTTNEWETIIKVARQKPSPFSTHSLQFDDFKDFKGAISSQLKKIPWMKVCWLRYSKENANIIQYKTSFEEDEFSQIKLIHKRGRPSEPTVNQAYNYRLPISNEKYNDLIGLCKDLIIPKSSHIFFEVLPHAASIKNALPEPDIEDASEEEM